MKKTILVMIIFLGLITNLLLSQDQQVKGTAETENINAYVIEKNISIEDLKTDSLTQTLEFPDNEKEKKITFLLKVGLFLPTEELFKDVYGSGLIYGGEIIYSLSKNILIHFGANLFSKTGSMISLGEETKINIIPAELGVSYKFSKTKISPYVGAGVGYYSLSEESFLGKVTGSNVGFFGQLGVAINLIESIVIDISAKYNLCNVTIDDIENNIGGITIGGGFGFNF